MIQSIMHDPLFLAQKSAPATPEDVPVARDLLETLTAHADGCVGMAANMIGVLKRIIAVEAEDGYLVLFNPVIRSSSSTCCCPSLLSVALLLVASRAKIATALLQHSKAPGGHTLGGFVRGKKLKSRSHRNGRSRAG